MPTSFVPNVPSTLPVVQSLRYDHLVYPYGVRGMTLDSAGVALASCLVYLFRTANNTLAGITTSDGSGNYVVPASNELTHYAVAYKAGATDQAGTTINTLTGA